MSNKDILVNSMAGYPLTLYIDRMADNINFHKEDNVVLNHLRYSMYQEILNAVGERTLSFDMLQQQIAVTLVRKQLETVCEKCLTLADKHEKPHVESQEQK